MNAQSDLLQELDKRRHGHTLPRRFYTDPIFYQVDLENVFYREWLFAGHDCELRRPGDFITLKIGEYPVVVVRARDGEIRAFHNSCRHRGSRICSAAKGSVVRLVCPYHNWSYELDGRLLFARDMGKSFDAKPYGLKPVHCQSIGGYIWLCLAPKAPDLSALRAKIEPYLAPHRLGEAKVAFESTIVEAGNWKLVWENNRECYHCNIGHPQYIRANYDIHEEALASAAVLERIAQAAARSEARWAERGLAATHREGGLAPFPDPVNNIWYSANRTLLAEGFHTESMDGRRVAPLLPGYDEEDVGVVRMRTMPNFWNHSSCDHAVSTRLLPAGLQKTLVRVYWLVHQDAQEGVDYDCERLLPFWQLTGEQDWKLCERAQRGVNSTGYEPGPLSTLREYNVEALLQWYLQQMQAAPAA